LVIGLKAQKGVSKPPSPPQSALLVHEAPGFWQ